MLGIYHTVFVKSSNAIFAFQANAPQPEGSLGNSERIILDGPQVISEQGQESWKEGHNPFSRNGVCSPWKHGRQKATPSFVAADSLIGQLCIRVIRHEMSLADSEVLL